jgi:hypothetical protein
VKYLPKIVCIEFNPLIPTEVEFIQPKDFNLKYGSSASSLVALGRKKGYELAAVTNCNLIFVKKELVDSLELSKDQIGTDLLMRLPIKPHYIWTAYDGTVLTSEPLKVHWHGFSTDIRNLQLLPKILRRFPDDYNFVQRKLFHIVKKFLTLD